MQRIVVFAVAVTRHGRLLVAVAKGVGPQVGRLNVGQIVPAKVGNRQLAEDVVEGRCCHLDHVVALDHPVRLEAGEGEAVDVFFQRYAVLEAQRHGDGEVVHHRPERRAFLVHVDEDLAQRAVFEFTGAQVELVSPNDRLLGVALTAVGQALPLRHALDDALDNPLGNDFGLLDRVGLCQCFGCIGCLLGVCIGVDQQGCTQRLRQLGAVTVERVRLNPQFPGQHVGVLDFADRRRVRHVDGLGNRPGDERLRRRHHADVGVGGQLTRALGPAAVRTVKDLHVLGLQVRRTLDRHRAANVLIGGFNIFGAEAHAREHVEVKVVQLRIGETKHIAAEVIPEAEAVEGKLELECRAQRGFDRLQLLIIEAARAQAVVIDTGRVRKRTRADSVGDDVIDLVAAVPEVLQRQRHRLVDDLEVAAAGELLELHQREVRLDPGGVTIHDQADSPRRGNHGGLRVAVTVLLTFAQRAIPGRLGGLDQRWNRAVIGHQWNGQNGQVFVAFGLAVGRAAVIADNPQHRRSIALVAREGTALGCDFSRGRVGHAGHQCRQTPTDGPAFVRIVA